MPSPVIQARLAPVALLVALAFVVVGFLRADREMTQREQDRAALMALETATLVEVFPATTGHPSFNRSIM